MNENEIPSELLDILLFSDVDLAVEVHAGVGDGRMTVHARGRKVCDLPWKFAWPLNSGLAWSFGEVDVAVTTIGHIADVLGIDIEDEPPFSPPKMTYQEAAAFLQSCPHAVANGALEALLEEWARNDLVEMDERRRERYDAEARMSG